MIFFSVDHVRVISFCFSVFIQTRASLCYQANKIMEHRRKYERKREEKEIKEKQERIKKAREEHARAQRVRFHFMEKYDKWPVKFSHHPG